MILRKTISCKDLPCQDINNEGHFVPNIEVDFDKIKIMMIAEVLPNDPSDYFYSKGKPVFMETTIQAFRDSGLNVNSIEEILEFGFYLTTAVKCAKIGYSVPTQAIKNCSFLLEKELDIFPNIKVIMLMGDVAIRALNYIVKRRKEERVIPAGSTYKIRESEFFWGNIRVFPSYLMTGKNYLIEKSKRRMIAEDINKAIKYIKAN